MVQPTPPLDDLRSHLRLFWPALQAGDRQITHRHHHRLMSAHAYLAHQALMRDADILANGWWGHRGILTAYTRAASLTPTVDIGLGGDGIAADLRDRGVVSPHSVWRAPFVTMGVLPTP